MMLPVGASAAALASQSCYRFITLSSYRRSDTFHCSPPSASRVVSVLDSGAVRPRFKRGRVTVLGKLFTPIVPLFTKQRADLHMAQLMPLPLTVSCFSKI